MTLLQTHPIVRISGGFDEGNALSAQLAKEPEAIAIRAGTFDVAELEEKIQTARESVGVEIQIGGFVSQIDDNRGPWRDLPGFEIKKRDAQALHIVGTKRISQQAAPE